MTRRVPALGAALSALCLLSVVTACGGPAASDDIRPGSGATSMEVITGGPTTSPSSSVTPTDPVTSSPAAISTAVPVRSTTQAVPSAPKPATTKPVAPKPAAPAPAPKPVGSLAFTSRTVAGADFDAATLAGRPVVLWFWAPWCGLCVGQAPDANAVAERFAGKVTVVGVGGLSKTKAMQDFVSRTKVSGFTNLADESGTVWKKFGVTEQGDYVLLDASGKIVHTGYLGGESLIDKVGRMVG